jgi:homoserine O-acetyltransferase
VPVLTMAITSDVLYPPHQQEQIHAIVISQGGSGNHALIHSDDGHDAFLIATDQVGEYVAPFLSDIQKTAKAQS